MHPMIARPLSVAMLVLAPVLCAAQSPTRPADPDQPIPKELALALLNLGPGINPSVDIKVGAAPDDVPPELLPAGLQVLGSTTQFEVTVVVLVAPQPPDSAISAYEGRLLSLGWVSPPPPEMQQMRGFVAADVGQPSYDKPATVCRGNDYVTLSGWYRRSGGSLLKVAYNRGTRYSMCKQREQSGYRSAYEEAPIPLLRAPYGSLSTGSGTSVSSDNSFSLSTQLTIRMKPAQIVAHYDRQMRDQGWASIGDGSLPFLAARSYRKTDDQHRVWTGMLLSVAFPDSSQQEVTLRLVRSQAVGAK